MGDLVRSAADKEALLDAIGAALMTIDKALEHVSMLNMQVLGMKSEGWMVIDHNHCQSHAVTVTEVPWTE